MPASVVVVRIVAVFVLLTVGGALVLTNCCSAWADPGSPEFQLFDKPPTANNLKMGTLDGRIFSVADLRGKVVILNFWRKNCRYCEQEKRYFGKMMQHINRPDLEVLCVNLWDSPSSIKKSYSPIDHGALIFATRPDDRPCVVENTVRGRVMGYYIVNEANEAIYEVKGFPSSYVINKEGRVVATHMGMADWSSQWVTRWLSGLLGRRETASPRAEVEDGLPPWIDRLLTSPVLTPPAASPRFEQQAQFEPVRHGAVPR